MCTSVWGGGVGEGAYVCACLYVCVYVRLQAVRINRRNYDRGAAPNSLSKSLLEISRQHRFFSPLAAHAPLGSRPSVRPPVRLSVLLPFCLPLRHCLSVCLFTCLAGCPSIWLRTVCSANLSVRQYVSAYMSIRPSTYLHLCQSTSSPIELPISLPMYLSVHLSVCSFLHLHVCLLIRVLSTRLIA